MPKDAMSAPNGYLREVVRPKTVPVAPIRRSHDYATVTHPQLPVRVSFAGDGLKSHAYDAFSPMIYEWWQYTKGVRSYIAEHNQGLELGEKGIFGIVPVSPEGTLSPARLKKYTHDVAIESLRMWIFGSRQATDPKAPKTVTREWLEELLTRNDRSTYEDLSRTEVLMATGISTVLFAMWNTLEAIPQVYARKHPGETISRGNLRDIAQGSFRHFILLLWSGNKQRVVPLFDGLTESYLTSADLGDSFNAKYLDIATIPGSGQQTLILPPEQGEQLLYSETERVVDKAVSEPTSGCPAPREVVEEMWQWVMDLADRFYFPQFPTSQAA